MELVFVSFVSEVSATSCSLAFIEAAILCSMLSILTAMLSSLVSMVESVFISLVSMVAPRFCSFLSRYFLACSNILFSSIHDITLFVTCFPSSVAVGVRGSSIRFSQ